ncbi:MAG: lamin tail domain-containing protein [Anaerolineae bacterium]|nr:lamin tail domain-containing protein [Anaerolineae bacterium]
MSLRSSLPFLIAVFIVAVAGTLLAINVIAPRVLPEAETRPVTVVVYITNTPVPNASPNVIVVTATSERAVVDVPDGLVPTANDTEVALGTPLTPPAPVTLEAADAAASGVNLPAGCLLHTIDDGDTIFGLAEEYGVNPFSMLQRNDLTEDEAIGLQIGDQIIVPLDTCPIEQVQPLPTNTPLPGEETEEVNVEATAEVTSEATAEASEAGPTATITLAPTAENSEIEISGVIARGDVTAEGIGIVNRGRTVSLDGWTLSDLDGNEYVFQEYRLFSNAEVVVYTRSGQNTPSVLFWGLNESVWDADDVVTLRDADGDVQAILRISPDNVDLP